MIIFSCEHASNQVPSEYQQMFAPHQLLLNSHQGYDIGAYAVFKSLVNAFPCKSIHGKYSRLLIELNRSLNSADLFSSVTKSLPDDIKQKIITIVYEPYVQTLISLISKELLSSKTVLHLSIHSFTPELNGVERKADIGLLYDPKRNNEVEFCKKLQTSMRKGAQYTVRRNYPYKGTSDGLTTLFRKQFSESYLGIEIEINQKHLLSQINISKITAFIIQNLKAIYSNYDQS